MKLSKFNLIGSSPEYPTHQLLYNTLQDHRILFSKDEMDIEDLFSKIKNSSFLNSKELAAINELKDLGVVLEDDVNEQQIFEDWYQSKIQYRNDMMQITILPAMNCNLACHYCFENEVRQNGLMKAEIVDQTIHWISQKVKEVRPQQLHLVFFGGEPLLHPKAIEKITKSLFSLCQQLHIHFEMGMITNGVLLRKDYVQDLSQHGWKWIKITFDGDKEAHDHKRVKHNGKGTFDIIYNNLVEVAPYLKIAIGGNFDEENYESMYALIERLKQSPFSDSIFTSRFKPIMKVQSDIGKEREGKITSFCEVCSFSQEQVNKIFSLDQHTREIGLPTMNRPDIGPCEFHQAYSVTISPDGNLYKCPAFAGIKQLSSGHVSEFEFNEIGKKQIQFLKWDEHCESCSYLPNCVGGCRYNALNKTGSLENKSCEIAYLKQSTDRFMRQEIESLMNSA